MNEVENEDLVFTLETIVEKFGEEISPFAVGLVQNLVAAFWKCLESNEGEDDEEPAGALASLGCLRAIISVLARRLPATPTLPPARPRPNLPPRRHPSRPCSPFAPQPSPRRTR